jgi:S-adenosyl methyltransferase
MTGGDTGALGDGDTAEKTPFDTSVAHQARMYDYVLGGKDNYAADRAAVEAGLKVWPDMAFAMRANRAFLGRAVRYLAADAGMRQFLDIGTGIPTSGNTHEIVQAIAPQSRVVYVDYDHCKSGCAHDRG